MRFVENGTPVFEGFINGSDEISQKRVFIDVDGERWFEVERGVFAYHPGQTRPQAEKAFERAGYAVTCTEQELLEDYPEGHFSLI